MDFNNLWIFACAALGGGVKGLFGWWETLGKTKEPFVFSKFARSFGVGAIAGAVPFTVAISQGASFTVPTALFGALSGAVVGDLSVEKIKNILAGMTQQQFDRILSFFAPSSQTPPPPTV